jgi:uncharacterized RDD family membrane protein YckC
MEPNSRDGSARASRNEPRRPHEAQGRASAIPREARPFQGLRAGIVSRTLAGIVDLGVVAVALLAGYLAVAGLRFLWRPTNFRFPSPSFSFLLLAGLVLLVPYLSVSWWLIGRTYGDYLFGLRVMSAQGKRMSLWWAVIRATFCVLLPLGLMWVALSRQDRSVQDVVLRTSVIYDWEVRPENERATRPSQT